MAIIVTNPEYVGLIGDRFFDRIFDAKLADRIYAQGWLDVWPYPPIGQLSGGQQQRVFLARALAQ